MTIAIAIYKKSESEWAKTNTNFSSTPAHLNKRLQLERILNNYIGSDSNQKHATPTSDSDSTTLA